MNKILSDSAERELQGCLASHPAGVQKVIIQAFILGYLAGSTDSKLDFVEKMKESRKEVEDGRV